MNRASAPGSYRLSCHMHRQGEQRCHTCQAVGYEHVHEVRCKSDRMLRIAIVPSHGMP